MSKVCYFPIKGIDDVIASRYGWTTVNSKGNVVPDACRVAMLRSIYDERNKKNPLDLDNLEDVSSKIRTLMEDIGKINIKAINTAINNKAKAQKKLKKVYSIRTREDRVRMIASYFSSILDEYQKRFPSIPRETIIKGFKDPHTGITIGGQAALFQDIYNRLMSNRNLYYRGSQEESFSMEKRNSYGRSCYELTKMLDPEIFASLVARSRFLLRDTEGIILGQTLDYVSKASLENYDDTELSEKLDLAESKKDGWMEKTDEKSAFGSVSLEVRKFLSTVPAIDDESIYSDYNTDTFNWNYIYYHYDSYIEKDDLGYPRYMDPATLHSHLMEVLDGAIDENHMVSLLKDEKGNPKRICYIPIIRALENNHRLRTQFFVDFKKGFQPYSIFFKDEKESKKRGYTVYRTKLLNRVTNLLTGSYMHRIMRGKPLSDKSIFGESTRTKKGKVNWKNLGNLKKEVYKWVHETPTTNPLARSDAKLLNPDIDKATKVVFLIDTFKAMGIDVKASTVETILTSNDIYKVRNILSEYFDLEGKNTGLNLALKDKANAFNNGEYSKLGDMSFYQLYNTKQKADDNKAKLREHTEKLLNIVSHIQENSRLESRCRHDNKTLFSYVTPNFMSDRLGAIKAYVKANDKKGLREYLQKEYCENSFLVDRNPNGEITHVYNYWLQTLLDCCDTPDKIRLEDTFAGVFVFERDLGNAETPFEKFGSKTHALDMIISFFADEEQHKSFKKVETVNGRKYPTRQQSALCPTFILGDSGVNKNLRVPRILEDNKQWGEKSKQKIVDYLYEVYRQEINRMRLVDAMNKKLTSEGYKVVKSTSEFSTLVFLNDPKYAPASNDMGTVKASIRKYMDDATKKFIQELDNLGVTEYQTDKEGKSTGKLKNLRQLGDTKEDIIPKLEDFYWNTKFATIEQLQLMTIDPAFYKGSKDLQKRYKEVHAPGSVLSLFARNPFKPGNPYFNCDAKGNPLPETCLYVDDIELSVEETDPKFAAAIKAHKETAEAIDKYRKSSLTDGQGWRTLTSYRKVMGMAGKWTHEMENCYDEIMDLRAKYGKRVPDKRDLGFDDYMNRLTSIAKHAVVFQPVKPYLFTHENYRINDGTYTNYADIMPIPVQHKYAEAVLIPELLPKGSKIRDMAYWMDEHKGKQGQDYPVDLIVATSVVKVGAFGSTSIKDASDYDSFIAALEKGFIHEFNYRDYRIQNNVPEHINSSQLFGTQIRKLIMSHLRLGGKYNYLKNLKKSPKTVNLGGKWGKVNAQELSGRNLLALYNSLIVANIMDSYDEFAKVVGDVNKLSDVLMQNILSNSRESLDNLLSYAITGNADFLMPLFEGALEHDTAAAILSIFKKKVNKQTIKGGSAVQVSAFGITQYERDGGLKFITDPNNPKNVLYAECEMPFDLSYYDYNLHKEVKLDYDTYCNVDGTLKVGKELRKGDPEYDNYISYVIGKDENGDEIRFIPLIEMDYPGILDIIAYRIPTERDYSMLNLKVKRFSRKTAGGTIRVPLQGTAIAGFDFDIDKLYFMRKEFRKHSYDTRYNENNYSEEDRIEIFNDIYDQYPEIKEALLVAKANSNNKSKPLNRYWDEADIERRFGYNKAELFEYHAKDLGIDPELEKYGENVSYFEEYDFDKAPEENTRTARNNLILDLIRGRLMDEETFAERYTPGGFTNASKAAKKLRFLLFGDTNKFSGPNVSEQLDKMAEDKNEVDPEPDYDPTDPMTIIIYNQQNQVAGTLIGIFANHNTNHAIASLMHSFMVKENNAIEFCGHKFNVDGVGRDFIHPPHRADGMNNVDLYVAELLAASVDAVKDPVLNYLNLNTITADSGATLIRLGYTAEEVGLLFNQPIIKKLCADCMNGSYSVQQGFKKLKNEYQTSVNPKLLPKELSKETLIQSILDERKTIASGSNDYIRNNIETQYAVLELFEKIYNVSQDVSQFVMNTKFTASNAVSSTFGGMYEQQMRVDDYCTNVLKGSENNSIDSSTIEMVVVEGNETMEALNTPIINRTDILYMKRSKYMDFIRMNPFGYEQAMYDANRKMLRLLAPEDKSKKALFPYGRTMYKGARDLLRDIANYNLDDTTIDSLHRDIPAFLLAHETSSAFCGEAEFEDRGISNREYYTKYFVEDLMQFLEYHPDLAKNNELFEYLKIEEEVNNDGVTTGFSMTVQDVGGLDPTKKDAIKEAWESLLDYPEYQAIANDLFMYCFYKLGFDFSSFTFMDLAPTGLKEKIVVKRSHSLPIATFTETKPGTNDVFVFYTGNKEHNDTAWNEYHYIDGAEGLSGDSYALNLYDENENIHYEVFKNLFNTARENPDRVFKVQTILEQSDIDEIAKLGDIPSNVQFTKETVLNNDWSDVSYGVDRSYTEFLNEILDGTNNSLDTEEFIKQFILNNLDNYRFVLNTYPDYLKEFFSGLVKGISIPKSIRVDVSNASSEVQSSLVKVNYSGTGQIISAKWQPVLKIGDNYYMANGDANMRFDLNKSLNMEYILVNPLGSKGKSKIYTTVQEEYSSGNSMKSETTSKDRVPPVPIEPITEKEDSHYKDKRKDTLLKIIENNILNRITQKLRKEDGSQYDDDEKRSMMKENMREWGVSENSSIESLEGLIESIKEAVREEGIDFVDEKGNKKPSC